MHHVSYDVEDMPLDKLLPSIARESHSVCMLTVSFAELSDVGCRKFLEEIEPHAHWRRLQPGDRSDRIPHVGGVLIEPGIREIDFSSNQFTSFERSGLTAAVENNATLSILELQGNELGSGAPAEARLDEIRRFAQAVGTSTLRALNITANRLGDAGLAAFFDALPRTGTTLKTLYLSVNTFDDASECLAAAKSIARFLSDPLASRGLERVHLNGNQFGWQGVRIIVDAVVGSRTACTYGCNAKPPADFVDASPPNRSLLFLDLFSNGIDSLVPSSDTETTYAFAWEAASRLTPANWSMLLSNQLEANERNRAACRKAAARLLPIARVVGCRSRDAGDPVDANAFPILRLPLELRGMILAYVAPELRHTQWTDVVRYACAPSTMGYGLRQVDYPIDTAPPAEMVLPVPPWSWAECFATRSRPRNWYGEWIDLQRALPDTSPTDHTSPDLLAFWECTGTDHA
ncbi:hypothetical protein GLX27_002237 [Malassezia furfur]|uniref:Uncharacterized protein n=1 Tax=Malassezia furfur TaxID=55194 RepID=A0ABY8ET59_MALFU|nr:hypothetical protein GLX27_002237 [Malassezia furfur]